MVSSKPCRPLAPLTSEFTKHITDSAKVWCNNVTSRGLEAESSFSAHRQRHEPALFPWRYSPNDQYGSSIRKLRGSYMFRNYLFVILMLSAVSPMGFFGQQRAGDVKKNVAEQEKTAIARLENKWLVALNNADVNAIAEVLDEDFARPAPDSGQFVHKAELLQFYRSHLSPLASGQQKRIQEMSVSVYGSTALARGVLITTDPDGRIIRKLLFTDVFVKRAQNWRAISAQENPVDLLRPSA